MSINATHHVGITVSDLETVLPFYRDILGLSVVETFEVSGDAFAEVVDVPDAAGSFAHLESPTGDARLELVEYEPSASPIGSSELTQPGASHVGFTVADLESVADGLPDDIETLSGPRTTASGTTLMFLRDPEGNLVELLEA